MQLLQPRRSSQLQMSYTCIGPTQAHHSPAQFAYRGCTIAISKDVKGRSEAEEQSKCAHSMRGKQNVPMYRMRH